ncbi:MAG: radical SAM family heme chaperone HemW [Desulfobulbaceae bacterium]|nr:radical SAM family heme chaperone HemW [Desulfobulbaceae bacterium]
MTYGPGLYLHVPFCLQKCPYCSFYSLSGRLDLSTRFVAAVNRQIERFSTRRETREQPFTTIFFGGGTPTMLPPTILTDLLQACLDRFPHANELEISIEVNPATIAQEGLQLLRRGGFNRLSIGVQSLNDQELKRIGRAHSANEAMQTVRMARQAGFTNISLDLMYGLPGQDEQSWQKNLNRALALEPDHLSLYELTIEENTPFGRRLNRNDLQLPDEEKVLAMMETTRRLTSGVGLSRYEISNYSRPGFQCRHNINYWQNGHYVGLGPGAVSRIGATRFTAVTDVELFCERLENERKEWQEEETLDKETRFRETVIMGLRMTKGVSLDALNKRFGIDPAVYYGTTLKLLMEQELVEMQQGWLRLTEPGLLLANTVMAQLV